MKKRCTRFLSMFLACLLAFLLAVMPAMASAEPEVSDTQTEETADTVDTAAAAEAADTADIGETVYADAETEAVVPEVNVIDVPDELTEVPAADASADVSADASDEAPASDEPTPDEDGVLQLTVSYYSGSTLIASEQVAQGQKPVNVPTTLSNGTAIIAWRLGSVNGTVTDPADYSVVTGVNFYAVRMPGLKTTDHTKYINGTSTTTFSPTQSLTRAQAAYILYTLLDSTTAGPNSVSFTDVASGSFYYNAITTLASYGVITGYSDGTFRPNNSVTRAEFVTMLVRLTGVETGSSTSFTDIPSTSWTVPYVSAAVAKGWVTGYTDGSFHPSSSITRAEAVVVMNRVLGRSPDSTAIANSADAAKFTDVSASAWYYYQVMEAAITHTYTVSGGVETWKDYTKKSTTYADGLNTIDGTLCYVQNGAKVYLNKGINKVGKGYVYAASAGYAVTADLFSKANTATFANGATQSLSDGFNRLGSSLFYWNTSTKTAKYLSAGVNFIDGKAYYADAAGYTIRNNFGAGVVELNGKLYISDGYCAIVTTGQAYSKGTATLAEISLAGHTYEYNNNMYYVQSDYSLAKNAWIGHLYFGSDGKYTSTDSTLDTYVYNILNTHVGLSNNATTQVQKLLKAYYYIRGGSGSSYSSSPFKYRAITGEGYKMRSYDGQYVYSWQISSAKYFYQNSYGMCYEWACGYLYLARRLGFNAYGVVGEVFASRARHNWCMIQWDGKWHISDVEVEWGYIAGWYSSGTSIYWNLFDQAVTGTGITSYVNSEYSTIKYYFTVED